MDVREKVALLGSASQHDLCGNSPTARSDRVGRELTNCVAQAIMAGGRRVTLLRVLLSSVCENDCAYCAMRGPRDIQRVAFAPAELARCFDQMWRAGLVEGLFLSSGIGTNAVREMDRMIATVEIVRQRYEFQGYVHLKVLPGAGPGQIERAVGLADRVSTNLEAPNAQRLAHLSQKKVFDGQLLGALQVANTFAQSAAWRPAPVSLTTQFVVGAADESDREILDTSARLYRELRLARIYYSRFSPVSDTPLENHAGTPPRREQRLYQADFLLRQYGFTFEDLVFDGRGNLPTDRDPKIAWAEAHPEQFPVEVNRASRDRLLRVPGIGPIVAGRILRERRQGRLTDLAHLRKLGAQVRRAAPFVLLDGRRPPLQTSFW